MKSLNFKKIFSVFLCLVIISASLSLTVYADDENETSQTTTEQSETTTTVTLEEAQKTLEKQRKELEKKLSESEDKLGKFSDDAKTTSEYIDALDEKIGYLNEELTLLDNEVATAQAKADELKEQIQPLQTELESLEKKYKKSQDEFDKLNREFQDTYDAYCLRLKAMYMSGNQSLFEALLTCNDISQLFSRYQMVKAVSQCDSELLKKVDEQMDEIINRQNGLKEQKEKVTEAKSQLDSKKADYDKQQQTIEDNQNEIAKKKVTLSEERAESDALLAQYTEETQMYTEFRNEDQELIDKVDNEIDDLLSGLKDPSEVTTADTSSSNHKNSQGSSSESSELYANSAAVLNLTYPAPGHYSVSQSFGHYRNGKAHTGIDYPCPTGSKIVAAQKGIVVTVKRLNYSYGYYVMIYHGTDSKGRKIVTLYAHNSSILVSVGQSVKKGQQIAKSGSTGNSTGPHCHFEMIIDGTKVNPKNYLSK